MIDLYSIFFMWKLRWHRMVMMCDSIFCFWYLETGWFVLSPTSHSFYTLHKLKEIHLWTFSGKVLSKHQHFSSAIIWVSYRSLLCHCECHVTFAIDMTNNNWLKFLIYANYLFLSHSFTTANTVGRRWTNSLSFIFGSAFCIPTIILANCKFSSF